MNSPAEFEKQIAEVRTVPASSFGTSMVVAPHPDDETLGCGGTVALLFKNNFQVHFIFVSDGTMSHPHSKKFPAPRLRELREKEAINAVEILGGKAENTAFLALPDRRVPTTDNPYFESIVRHLVTRIELLKPESIFIPWQNDPHPDHRATWQLLTEAVARSERLCDIWLPELNCLNRNPSLFPGKMIHILTIVRPGNC